MALSVPPLLEEMGLGVTSGAGHTLATWQETLWRAAQRLREDMEPATGHPRWMGTVAQLTSVIGGSVVMGGDGTSPDVVPLSTDATPTAKSSPSGPMIRLEGPPGQKGRYVSLAVVIGSSFGLWPAAIAVGDGGGRHAGHLRDLNGRPIELQVIARSSSRMAFRLVVKASGEVLSVSDTVEELVNFVGHGPRPVPWAGFLETCPWGRPAANPPPSGSTRTVATGNNFKAIAALWGLAPLLQDQVPLVAVVAFVATAAELPQPRALANEIVSYWDEITDPNSKPLFDGAQLLRAADELAKGMLPGASIPAVLEAVKQAQSMGAVDVAVYLGEVLRDSLSAAGMRTTTATTAANTLESPGRARRSQHAPAGAPTYLTTVTPHSTPAASPARPSQGQAGTAREVDSDGDDILSPRSMRKELKRLRQLVAPPSVTRAISTDEDGLQEADSRKVAKKGVTSTRGGVGRGPTIAAGLPEGLSDLSAEVVPVASVPPATPSGRSVVAHSIGATAAAQMPSVMGPTMGDCIQMGHTSEVRRLIPASADDQPLKELSVLLEIGGMPDAPITFAQAATTVNTGIVPGKGTALEAEMLAEHMAAVLDDLAKAGAFPVDHQAFSGGVRPDDWVQAAARGRALILATARAFRTARQLGGAAGGTSSADNGATTTKMSNKVPEDAYVKVSEATTAPLKNLAVSADVLNSLASDSALSGERLRGSPFERLTEHTREDLDAALPGELDYFVGMYGQAASAYVVSNSRSIEEVSGKGVPVALAGVRRHLWLRALRWVTEAYGERRATRRKADVEKLALSLLTGAVPSEPVGTEGEKLIIELMGGSKPHKGAEVEREGGSLTAGTVGQLVGESAQYSVRAAYRKWAKGVARCMGEVLLASRGREVDRTEVLGLEGDFGIEEALGHVTHDLPAERVRSMGRYLLEEIHVACGHHRVDPGATLPDIITIVDEMGGEVFKHRRQEHQLESLAQAAAAKIAETLEDRLKAIEGRHGQGSTAAKNEGKPAQASKPGKQPSKPGDGKQKQAKTEAKRDGRPAGRAAGIDLDDGAVTTTAKSAAKALEESMKSESSDPLDSRMRAVSALQVEYRKSVGAPIHRRMDEKEPCAWLALVGKCKEAKCKPCAGGMSFDASMITAVKARCVAGLFGGGKPQPAKEPG